MSASRSPVQVRGTGVYLCSVLVVCVFACVHPAVSVASDFAWCYSRTAGRYALATLQLRDVNSHQNDAGTETCLGRLARPALAMR